MLFLSIWDLVLTPIYLLIIIFIAKRYRDRKFPPGHPLRKYYLPGLYVKLLGAIFIGLLYEFYYAGGDTSNYFKHAQIINSALDDSVVTWFKLLLRVSDASDPSLYSYTSQMIIYHDPPSYIVSSISAVLGLLNFTTYLPIALLFAYLSYTGIWAMFRTFTNLYPALHKQLAIAFLFIPSVFVWGSSIYKDTVCMFALGWMTYTTFRIFVNRDFSLRNIFLLCISFYLLAVIKVYILLAFVPALAAWLLLTYSHKVRSFAARVFLMLIVGGFVVGGLVFLSQQFAKELNRYSLEKIVKTANVTRGYISSVSERESGSAYNLGELDGSLGSMLSKFPAGVVVTLFRPFPWEANKPIIMLSALEALIFLFFFLKAIAKHRFRIFRVVADDPNLIFCLLFSLVFAFAVGITSYNFGTLSRYKIPCLPFFATFLVILLYKDRQPARAKTRTVNKRLLSSPLAQN
jgi:hypothetical protein